jgi:hypothetical protein
MEIGFIDKDDQIEELEEELEELKEEKKRHRFRKFRFTVAGILIVLSYLAGKEAAKKKEPGKQE